MCSRNLITVLRFLTKNFTGFFAQTEGGLAGFRVTGLLQDKVSLMTCAGNGICQAFASVGILDSVLAGTKSSNSQGE